MKVHSKVGSKKGRPTYRTPSTFIARTVDTVSRTRMLGLRQKRRQNPY
ncbi:hypothetical protein IPJ70_00850 [Candidatus Campbellbacteria bacterium]|nr:MAG: hypothetical protein IPJ70_00850 [Candidatus Campbellbacteria bacterium]